MNKIFLTGASGFVGKHLTRELAKRKLAFIAGERRLYGDLNSQNNWKDILKDCDVVIHLAARVHVMSESDTNPLEAFRKTNVEVSLNIARAAKAIGIRRFIYISSIKVNGEETQETPFNALDLPAPKDAYGISKAEAEAALMKMHEPGIFEVVVIRPPLVYGPGVKANFEKLFWLVRKDLPIPFGKVNNKRSLVSVFNLCDLIIHCVDNPNASGEVFLISDDYDYSLKELITLMANASQKHAHLLSVPISIMKLVARLLGKKDYANRLFGNLQVDITKTKSLLNWHPPYTFEQTYKKTNVEH